MDVVAHRIISIRGRSLRLDLYVRKTEDPGTHVDRMLVFTSDVHRRSRMPKCIPLTPERYANWVDFQTRGLGDQREKLSRVEASLQATSPDVDSRAALSHLDVEDTVPVVEFMERPDEEELFPFLEAMNGSAELPAVIEA